MASTSTSTYYHATLYAFNDAASRKVVTQFIGAMHSDISVACHYDTSLDMFCVTCQTVQGANADATLSQIIRHYVDKELESADREERDPDVVRFPQSKFDALDSLSDEEADTRLQTPAGSATLALNNPPRTHIVITLEDQGKLARLFPLHELQEFGLLERYIAPKTRRSQKVFEKALVVRATQWSSTDGYVFNGRREGSQLITSPNQHPSLELPPFAPMCDVRPGAKYEPVEASPVKQWEFVEGHEDVSVQQWLRGAGQTRQIDPETKPDVPKDAKLMIAAQQSHTTGRARVPRGMNILDSDEEDSDDASSSGDESDDITFAALVGKDGPSEPALKLFAAQSDADGNASSGSELDSSFQSLLPGNKDKRVSKKLSQRRVEAPPGNVDDRRQDIVPRATGQWTGADRKYTKVDKIGLTANPTSTAQWEHENNQNQWSRKAKARANRVVPRHAATASVASLPQSAPHALSGADVSSLAASHASASSMADAESCVTQIHAPAAHWANKPDPARVRTGKLLDFSSSVPTAPPKVPPGFDQGNRRQLQQHQVACTKPIAGPTQPLIDISETQFDGLSDNTVPPPKVSERSTVLKPRPGSPPAITAKPGTGVDDLPIEGLEQLPEDWTMKKNTMRQKAGKNVHGKGKGKRQAQSKDSFNVQLDLPDPVPAPKLKPKRIEPAEEQSAHRQASKRPITDQSVPWLKGSTRLSKDNHAFGKALNSEIIKQQNLEDEDIEAASVKLHCNVGVVLVRPDESAKTVAHGASDPVELQSKLRELNGHIRTDFLQRMTTSEEDARYIIAVGAEVGGDFIASSSRAWYELLVRDSAGALLKVIVTADQGNDAPRIEAPDTVLAEAICHFPISVWDARFTLQRSGLEYESPAQQAIKDFVLSMETDQNPPSFRAMVSKGLFGVERVQAKRSCTRQFLGWSLTITEVEELVTEALVLEHYNFRALSLARDEMIAEQRYFYEASWETYDLTKADELQARVAGMIGHMDCVGLGNQGPWVLHHGYRSDDNDTEVPDPPFW